MARIDWNRPKRASVSSDEAQARELKAAARAGRRWKPQPSKAELRAMLATAMAASNREAGR